MVPRTNRSHRRALALVAAVAVAVIGLAVGASPSKTSVATPTSAALPITDSPGIGPARQTCTLFATLVSDLQSGKLTPAALGPGVAAIDQKAGAASSADQATFAKLASDAHAFDVAVVGNDPATGQAAQALATDCQGILGSGPAKT